MPTREYNEGMADVQFEEGTVSSDGGGGETSEARGMVGWLIRLSGGRFTPTTANIILACFGVAMILLSIIIVWRL